MKKFQQDYKSQDGTENLAIPSPLAPIPRELLTAACDSFWENVCARPSLQEPASGGVAVHVSFVFRVTRAIASTPVLQPSQQGSHMTTSQAASSCFSLAPQRRVSPQLTFSPLLVLPPEPLSPAALPLHYPSRGLVAPQSLGCMPRARPSARTPFLRL